MTHQVYLDNNATTKTCSLAKTQMVKWIQACSNPSGSSVLSAKAATLIQKTKEWIQKLCNAKEYTVLFTSGATESNCLIIRSIVDAWLKRVGTRPHIVTSAIEHKSILDCLNQLISLKRVEVTVIQPNSYGQIDPNAVQKAIQPNTALISIMGANNETGIINPLSKIAILAHEKKIPFHSDCVQLFGKMKLDLPTLGLDAISMSFHKMYGPMGLGLLIVKNSLIKGYKLESQINGSQQDGLRGGTENVPAIAGAAAALIDNFKDRARKNKKLDHMRQLIIDGLKKHYTLIEEVKLPDLEIPLRGNETKIVIIGSQKQRIPNTLLMSVLNYDKPVCNGKMKKALEKRGFIVSIGSACNTSSPKASHVLEAMKAPPVVKRGTLRISLGDTNTPDEAKKFAVAMHEMITNDDIWN